MLSPHSRDNDEIVQVATMDTISLKDNEIEPQRGLLRCLPWLPRTQPHRVWTPNGLHGATFLAFDNVDSSLQVYE